MFRKLLLILCLAFGVLAFGYPCLVLPVGNYSMTVDKVTTSYQFNWNGKGTMKITLNPDEGEKQETTTDFYYKLDWKNGVKISADETFDDDDITLPISNIFRLGSKFKNQIAMWISIGVGVLDLLLVLTIRKKRA